MFKNVSYKKLNWIKNASQDGGAMNEAIKTMKDDDVCIHIQNRKNGRMWAASGPNHLLTMLNKNIGLYEVITKFPHKVYFDVDCEDETPLETSKSIILSHIPDALFAISGSETETKNSYHIVLTNYNINNIVERENFKLFVMALHQENNGFDTKV